MNTFEQWLIVVLLSILIMLGVYFYVMSSNRDWPASAEKAVPDGKDWNGRERHDTPGIGHNGGPPLETWEAGL